MELPDAPERSAVLEPDLDGTAVRGLRDDELPLDPLAMRLAVEGPVHLRIRAEDVEHDPDLTRFIEREGAKYNFFAVRLSCSFRPGDGETFTGCWVGIDLARVEDVLDEEQPIAWSMEPQRLEKITDVPKSFTFSASLKLPFVDFGGSITRAGGSEPTNALLQAYGELGSEPSWEFAIVGGNDIKGMQLLKLVVRSPAGVPVQGRTSIEANVKRSRFKVMKYRARVLGDPPGCDFKLE